MALRVRGAPQLATLSRACHILRPHRQVTTATGSIDVATETDLKSSSALPASEGSVSFAPLKVAWKPRVSTQKVAVEGSRLFASSNDPHQCSGKLIGWQCWFWNALLRQCLAVESRSWALVGSPCGLLPTKANFEPSFHLSGLCHAG